MVTYEDGLKKMGLQQPYQSYRLGTEALNLPSKPRDTGIPRRFSARLDRGVAGISSGGIAVDVEITPRPRLESRRAETDDTGSSWLPSYYRSDSHERGRRESELAYLGRDRDRGAFPRI